MSGIMDRCISIRRLTRSRCAGMNARSSDPLSCGHVHFAHLAVHGGEQAGRHLTMHRRHRLHTVTAGAHHPLYVLLHLVHHPAARHPAHLAVHPWHPLHAARRIHVHPGVVGVVTARPAPVCRPTRGHRGRYTKGG
jgi:hypothetical protein